MPQHFARKTITIGAVNISLQDVANIYERLKLQVAEQADSEISKLIRRENQTAEDFEQYKLNAKSQAFKVKVTFTGRGGDSLFGDDKTIFSSPNKPERLDSLYITNMTAYQHFANKRPVNMFELNIDFSKPPLMDANNPVSSPTRNMSNLVVQGDRDSWVSAVSDAVMTTLKARKTRRNWIHRAFSYDIGLAILGIPFAFYLCRNISPLIYKYIGNIHDVLSGDAYVYTFFLALSFYRILFGYAKWAFPTVELSDNKDAAIQHRALLGVIVLGLVIDIIWQILHG